MTRMFSVLHLEPTTHMSDCQLSHLQDQILLDLTYRHKDNRLRATNSWHTGRNEQGKRRVVWIIPTKMAERKHREIHDVEHAWNYLWSTCPQVDSWRLGSKLVVSNNQSNATLWVLDTCLIVVLLAFMIILITTSLSRTCRTELHIEKNLRLWQCDPHLTVH